MQLQQSLLVAAALVTAAMALPSPDKRADTPDLVDETAPSATIVGSSNPEKRYEAVYDDDKGGSYTSAIAPAPSGYSGNRDGARASVDALFADVAAAAATIDPAKAVFTFAP